MKLTSLVLATLALAVMVGLAYVAKKDAPEAAPAGGKMVAAAQSFLESLDDKQKEKTVFAFDSKERTNWNFVPLQDREKKSTRKGLPLQDMTAKQKELALALVAAGTSAEGNKKATTIMSLEAILRDLEKGGAMVREPQWYFFTFFGNPSKSGKWGWRVEGHHLSLNFTMEGDKLISSTPAFFGANPATVKSGSRKGLRTLPEAEEPFRELVASLSDKQKEMAQQKKGFPEPGQKTIKPHLGEPVGVPVSQMTDKQKDILVKLLEGYANRMPRDVADAEMKQVRDAGIDKIYFAFSGTGEAGKPYTYRVHGPTFVIEFLNEQADSAGNRANHIHSVWRNIKGDFGMEGS